MQKKNIDDIFRDKLSDFKQNPDNKVWRAIDASLDKKKKKRVIPIWWSLSGIAAAIAIGLLVINPFSDNQLSNEILVDTDTESEINNDSQLNTEKDTFIDSIDINKNQVAEQEISVKNSASSVENNTESTQQESRKIIKPTAKTLDNYNGKNQNSVADNKKPITPSKSTTNDALLAENITIKENSTKNSLHTDANVNDKNSTMQSNNSFEQLGSTELTNETAIAQNTNTDETPENAKKSIFEEIEDQEDLKVEKVANNRWSAGPNVAPVYFNALGEGSPVNSIFSPNAKSGNVNMSYGVSLAYAVTKKLTIRSGINKVDYGYDTEDVAFSSSSGLASKNSQLTTIDYAETSNTLTISSKVVASDKFSTISSALDVTAKSPTREGYMSQQFGYIELPVELNYALIDKKFGVNLIGGVSSLFLIDNTVSLTSGELTTEIGEANNINDLNFSANMGLGVNYNFSQKVRFNIEPIFKYQLNTFSDVNGTFRPYSVGVYSGLTFQF
ncbi:outer membrane beta-barrel protein [Maribacter spongiicola]|uniref:outer membrane beta-barrel protein n=1 Tax=Maribacter spongiicola TaxID=1206753 RepID=UPI003F99BD16